MTIWPFGRERGTGLSDDQLLALICDTPGRAIDYAIGGLFVHSGNQYHQARGLPHEAGQWRITVQGHGIWQCGQWQFFW